MLCLFGLIGAMAQTKTATGVVTDQAGEAVIGASVIVKGTTNGTITDLDGKFTLGNVKNGDIIQISFVGYKTQEIKFAGQTLNVILHDDTEVLDEVVVTGYGGSQKRATLTTAISKLDNSVLKKCSVQQCRAVFARICNRASGGKHYRSTGYESGYYITWWGDYHW